MNAAWETPGFRRAQMRYENLTPPELPDGAALCDWCQRLYDEDADGQCEKCWSCPSCAECDDCNTPCVHCRNCACWEDE